MFGESPSPLIPYSLIAAKKISSQSNTTVNLNNTEQLILTILRCVHEIPPHFLYEDEIIVMSTITPPSINHLMRKFHIISD